MATVQGVTQNVSRAISEKDGVRLASALQRDLGNRSLLEQLHHGHVDVQKACDMALEEPYDEMLLYHFYYLRETSKGDPVEAYNHCEKACGLFCKVFEKDTHWSLPVLHELTLSLRLAALAADQAAGSGKKEKKREEAANMLQKFFKVTMNDRTPLHSSKRWGVLGVVNHLFKIYFSINNLRLCQNLIRAIEMNMKEALEGKEQAGRSFKMAELTTYKYFVGRLSLLNSQLSRANEELSFAFDKCPASHPKNKRLILRSLVPVRMALGKFPSPRLLQKYRLSFYVPVCRAVHLGDVKTFEDELAKLQQDLIRHGSYLLVERSKLIAYRNFFRRVHMLTEERDGAKTTKLSISKFRACLSATGVEMDSDEIECLLANLVYSGYIKGYISHQHGKLVVSKGNAFPPVRDVVEGAS
uniref:PCI domain-containing protein n=1 Tax=Calcidiscus leptoporus TaxID=127549 RepID=A0A7S0JEN6_9EUKA|mmetsp:Transcript_5428/g.12497  ORF Transcript_5428/g.12497 Transcript_5428/m.12497 type:complete len:413 (+) Transcript_5428:39-1277(+)|eukprot:CAMPEP_0119364644 /NCGR_PEP_ID=MMETSP1334-20130426/11558_1 /TAXON_ID=127549 /ORGANISM="Calcidiscus leptoporus, Strain RCC1130" /LENGTH=412 /DNA_ID=CAMNT_0007380401 /DNA_START=43 /DNA_END=1281 /DNA_ORIENTATION=-